jgi:hypothetical protein
MTQSLLALTCAIGAAALLGCGSDGNLRDRARCDGTLNTVEQTVDDAFDSDGDGYFDAASAECQDTYPADQLDCDDEDPDVNPGVLEETCNGIDDDCDPGTSDEPDADEDGFTPCEGDCDDAQPSVAPGLPEIACDGLDNDCDGSTSDGADVDLDNDGYDQCDDCDDTNAEVNPATAEVVCNGADDDCNEITPDGDDFDNDGFVHCFDCDDADPLRYPGAVDICEDGIDQNCDTIDPDCPPPTWDGIWATNTNSYTCAGGAVIINFSSISVIDNNPQISFTFIGESQPGTLTGTLGAGDTFSATYSIAGLCTENYGFTGSFTSGSTFAGTFTAQFVDTSGTGLGCLGCADQTFSVNGAR